MLAGRLGLETARIPHADRHGLLSLDRGQLFVEDGCLSFTGGGGSVPPGRYAIPHQSLSLLLMGPGSSITHDALRILARSGVGLAAVGDDGVRFYTAPPLGTGDSALARAQATLWADPKSRISVARRMYAIRLGEILPNREIDALRGVEGARVKETYAILAKKHRIRWEGRRYDRAAPEAADIPNQAINHASSAMEAAAAVACAACGAIPQLGFIHEASSSAFVLDVSDLYRADVTVEAAFEAAAAFGRDPSQSIERLTRKTVGSHLRKGKVIAQMIDRIKVVLGV